MVAGVLILSLVLAQIWEVARRRTISNDPRVCTPVWKPYFVARLVRRAIRTLGFPASPTPTDTPQTPADTPQRPSLRLPQLTIGEVVSGLEFPTTLAFVNPDGFLVLEQRTGRVRYVQNGTIVGTALDLGVDWSGERGGLGILAHPRFRENGFIYIYWTARLVNRSALPGKDAEDAAQELDRINRVDRFVWNGTSLVFDRNILTLPSNATETYFKSRLTIHNGGVMLFGRDEKLLVVNGDQVLRGQLQNVFDGPSPTHKNLTGIILRLNGDGSIPSDNPFYKFGLDMGGEVGANLMRIFAYGIRNSFGMDLNPSNGELWITENGLKHFDEINRVPPGFNSGWVQIMGPDVCFDQYVALEKPLNAGYLGVNPAFRSDRLAHSAEEARKRLVRFPNSVYVEPVFSWKFVVSPTALHFVRSEKLSGLVGHGSVLVGDISGRIYRFVLDKDGKGFQFSDKRLSDRTADGSSARDDSELESLVIGTWFGLITDIETSPNGTLFVVSLSHGKIYEIRP